MPAAAQRHDTGPGRDRYRRGMERTILVTGGAGFIGSALVRRLIDRTEYGIVTVDKLTYAGHEENLGHARNHPRHRLEVVDIVDSGEVERVFTTYKPSAVIHLAAESHVDRSIDGPAQFVRTNVQGTFTLLEAARKYWEGLSGDEWEAFRFIHVSTDEVFGSLGEEGIFTEETPYDPRSPYSASKAAADHLARSYFHTYELPVVITNCSNNYGPYQFPEKLIPHTIQRALAREEIPVYGRGDNVRDWLHVDDHVEALQAVLEGGRIGETYAIGGRAERRNIEVVTTVCEALEELLPDRGPFADLITFVDDRPGHDFRYAIDPTKVENELGWYPRYMFETGIRQTVEWYLDNQEWCEQVARKAGYRLQRLGSG